MIKIKCLNCENEETFYQKFTYYGRGRTYFDGKGEYLEDGTNADMYNNAKHTNGTYLYCNTCDKRIMKIEELHS